jgi:hypothetical protein
VVIDGLLDIFQLFAGEGWNIKIYHDNQCRT